MELRPTDAGLAWLSVWLLCTVGCGGDAAAAGDGGVDGGVDGGGGLPVAQPATVARPVRTDAVHCRLSGTRAGALPRARLTALAGPSLPQVVAATRAGDSLLVADGGGSLLRVAVDADDYLVEDLGQLSLGGRLLELVAHPQFVDNGYLYAHAVPGADPSSSVVSRLRVDPVGWQLDAAPPTVVLRIGRRDPERPGGALVFDADGMLLIGVGDGGQGGEIYRDALDPTVLAGKVLRIDVDAIDAGGVYGIPVDNPFAMSAGVERPEVYALGMRDPRRCALSPAGVVVCSDAGDGRVELNRVEAGANYGWPERDGVLCVATGRLCLDDRFAAPASIEPLVEGRCGLSGLAFQGADEPIHLHEVAVAGDGCDGRLAGLSTAPALGVPPSGSMVRAAASTAVLASGPQGSLLRIDSAGTLQRIEMADDGVPGTFPERISQTGCYADVAAFEPAPDLIGFEVASPLWTDGAHKRRFMVVPAGQRIEAPATGPWTFPVGTILVKEFALQFGRDAGSVRPVETRFMIKREIGWEFYGYRWNEEATDAVLVESDETVSYTLWDGPLDYQFPGPATCPVCHSAAPGRPLGPRTEQLNRPVPYDDGVDDQLSVLASLDLLDGPVADGSVDGSVDLEGLPQLPDPADDTLPVEPRVRSYLQANCAHCHQPGGWSSPSLTLDLRYELPLADTQTCDVDTQFMRSRGKRIDPGNPDNSSLLGRMVETGIERMPPVATTVVDPLAERLMREWIDQVQCR